MNLLCVWLAAAAAATQFRLVEVQAEVSGQVGTEQAEVLLAHLLGQERERAVDAALLPTSMQWTRPAMVIVAGAGQGTFQADVDMSALVQRWGVDVQQPSGELLPGHIYSVETTAIRSLQTTTPLIIAFTPSFSHSASHFPLLGRRQEFDSQEACRDRTGSCSGHGECRQHRATSAFRCVCAATNGTSWSGNACQKVDVSTEFHLFFWTSLLLLVLVVWSIRLMVQAGNADMGSVLGATGYVKRTL